MSLVKLASKLPNDHELNGLDHWIKQLKTQPFEQLIAIAYISTQKTINDYEKSEVTPVVQIVAVEVVGDVRDAPGEVIAAFCAAHDRRLNQSALFDHEESAAGSTDGGGELLAITAGDQDVIDAEIVEEDR
jgi:hypothetical protein